MKNETFQLAKPLGDRVLIETKVEETTVNGIIIPDSAKLGDNKIGKVVSVGEGIYTNDGVLIPMAVKVGDSVMLPGGSMNINNVKLGGKDYMLCREMDLLMIIK
jgi:chaperonin GroES